MITLSTINYARWICATILHLSIIDQIIGSLQRMKYTLNHTYKFQSPGRAFLCSLLEFFITLAVEIANILIILAQSNPINIVLNFIAIAIIGQFDEYIYVALRNETGKLLVESNISESSLIIHHTTSGRCGVDELSDVKDDKGNYRKLRILFKDRTWKNKIAWAIYRILRSFFVSMYFYFFPFFVIGLSIVIPLNYIARTGNAPV